MVTCKTGVGNADVCGTDVDSIDVYETNGGNIDKAVIVEIVAWAMDMDVGRLEFDKV